MRRGIGVAVLTAAVVGASGFEPAHIEPEPQRPEAVFEAAGWGGGTRREATVSLDPTVLGRDTPVGTVIALTPFPDVTLDVVLDEVLDGDLGSHTWVGSVNGRPQAATLTIHEGIVHGMIRDAGLRYRVASSGNGAHTITEFAGQGPVGHASPGDSGVVVDSLDAGWTLGQSDAYAGDPNPVEFMIPKADAVDDGSVIRVLTVYTPQVAQELGGRAAAEAEILSYYALTNLAYANSGIIQRVEVAGIREIPNPTDEIYDDQSVLEMLRDPMFGLFGEAHVLRDATKADLVMLVYETGFSCGVAFLLTRFDGFPHPSASGFGVINLNPLTGGFCERDKSFAHELGHLMAAQHNPEHAGATPMFDHAYGHYSFSKEFVTIMSYWFVCDENGVDCDSIPYFSNPNVSFDGEPTGTATRNNALTLDKTRKFVANYRPGLVFRYWGGNRYVTAAATSLADFAEEPETVFVAVGTGFPDALAGAVAAGRSGAPLLLTTTASLPTITKTELARMKPKTIVILGGTAVISNAVRDELAAFGDVVRLAGSDRYETSVAISQFGFPDPDEVDEVIIATGVNFPDALGGGPVGARRGAPVLLTHTNALPDLVRDEILRLGPASITVLGGPGAISDQVVAALNQIAPTTRLAGNDRFETAVLASQHAFPEGADRVYVAVGDNFPDALAGAAAAGVFEGPVLLTRSTSVPSVVAAELARLKPKEIVLMGGFAVVSFDVEMALEAYIHS